MDIPNFIQHPPSDTEMETARLFAQNKDPQQIAQQRCLSVETIRTHLKSLRYKFHTDCSTKALLRMIALRYIAGDNLHCCIPVGWHQYIKQDK